MTHLLAFMPGGIELLWILLAILLLFGGRKLPELARAMGSSITQFKRGLKDEEEETPELQAGEESKKGDGA